MSLAVPPSSTSLSACVDGPLCRREPWRVYNLRSYGAGVLFVAVVAMPAVVAPTGTEDERQAPRLASVSGQVSLLENQDKLAHDVGQAVIWLASPGAVAAAPDTVEIMMSQREFRPHVMVVSVGTTMSFPNSDPFNHNVFSRSAAGPFDLGDYARGGTESVLLRRPGVMLVLCNIHAQMSAIVVVRDNPYYTQPAADGSFRIVGVPPGDYVLHAWHERARAFTPQSLRVAASGIGDLTIEIDTRIHTFVPQLNEYGQPYSRVRRGRRY